MYSELLDAIGNARAELDGRLLKSPDACRASLICFMCTEFVFRRTAHKSTPSEKELHEGDAGGNQNPPNIPTLLTYIDRLSQTSINTTASMFRPHLTSLEP